MEFYSIFIWQCSEVANTGACKALIVRSNRTTASKYNNKVQRIFKDYKINDTQVLILFNEMIS